MYFEKIDQGCVLVDGMAERLGADIPGAVNQDPEAVASAFRTAVLRCAACGEHEACKKLQADNATLDKAPTYCRNW